LAQNRKIFSYDHVLKYDVSAVQMKSLS